MTTKDADLAFTPAFNEFVDDLRTTFGVPSFCIGVVDSAGQATKAYGQASPDIAATEDTLHYIASCTKSFTALTLLCLLEELKHELNPVTLNTKIADVLPDDFVLPDEYATRHATIEDALSHQLGIGNHNFHYGGPDYTLSDAVRSLRHLPMAAELRERFEYANLGYMIIQRVMETLTGEFIGEAHRKYIWEPLGMGSTYIRLRDARECGKQLATGHTMSADGKTVLATGGHVADYPLVGGGGIISSLADMTKYLKAVMRNEFDVPDSSWNELFRPRSIAREPSSKNMSTVLYALGWNVSSYRGHRIVFHNGGINGFSAKMIFLPDREWGAVVLTNADIGAAHANEVIAMRLMDDYLGIPLAEREDVVPQRRKEIEAYLQKDHEARSILYPGVETAREPLRKPLRAYTGTYSHPSYGRIHLDLAAPRAGIPISNRISAVLHAKVEKWMTFFLDLEHVSGEDFIVWVDTEPASAFSRSGRRARVEHNGEGKVKRLGLNLDVFSQADDPLMMMWFDKVDR